MKMSDILDGLLMWLMEWCEWLAEKTENGIDRVIDFFKDKDETDD